MFANIVEVADGLLQTHAIDGLCSFTSVLEVDTEVRAASLGRLCWVDGRCCVADHWCEYRLDGSLRFRGRLVIVLQRLITAVTVVEYPTLVVIPQKLRGWSRALVPY